MFLRHVCCHVQTVTAVPSAAVACKAGRSCNILCLPATRSHALSVLQERFTDLLAASAHPPPAGSNNSSGGGGSHHGARSVHFRPPLHHHRHAAAPVKYSWRKVTLTNSTEMKALVQHVLRKRHTASTCLNDKSSRSHVIVTITLEQRKAINEHTYAAAEGDEPPCSSASSLTVAAASSSIGGSTSDLSSLRHLDSVETRSVQDDAASEAGSAAAAPADTYLIG